VVILKKKIKKLFTLPRQVIDRILYKLDDLVRPYVHKILVVIEPLLIDEDYYARVEGREIISNLAKAAGLATMISVMRPDIDNMDEWVLFSWNLWSTVVFPLKKILPWANFVSAGEIILGLSQLNFELHLVFFDHNWIRF